MIIIITGGSGSGKSAYAEERALMYKELPLYYLATMRIYDKEGEEKVQRHRKLREGNGFITIEQPINIEKATENIEKDAVILLECMSNLIANEMFKEQQITESKQVVRDVMQGIHILSEKARVLIIVTNNIFEDGIHYDDTTKQYMKTLGLVNKKIVSIAEEVIEVVVGIPLKWVSQKK